MKKIFPIVLVLAFVCLVHKISAQQKSESIGIVNAMAKYLPQPELSKEAGIACAGGNVEVEIRFHAFKGNVVSAKAISGNKLLRKTSEEAAKKAIFSEANFDGKKDVYIIGIIVYNFPQPKCVGANILNGKARNIPKPQVDKILGNVKINYPQTVFVQVSVDTNGNVTSAKALSGHPLLRPACETSARQTKFSSSLVDTKIENYTGGILRYDFKLEKKVKF